MLEVIQEKKKVAELWKEFDEISNRMTEEDCNYFEKNCKDVKDTLEFEIMNEIEYEGSSKLYLDYPKEVLEKAIQEIKDYYNKE